MNLKRTTMMQIKIKLPQIYGVFILDDEIEVFVFKLVEKLQLCLLVNKS